MFTFPSSSEHPTNFLSFAVVRVVPEVEVLVVGVDDRERARIVVELEKEIAGRRVARDVRPAVRVRQLDHSGDGEGVRDVGGAPVVRRIRESRVAGRLRIQRLEAVQYAARLLLFRLQIPAERVAHDELHRDGIRRAAVGKSPFEVYRLAFARPFAKADEPVRPPAFVHVAGKAAVSHDGDVFRIAGNAKPGSGIVEIFVVGRLELRLEPELHVSRHRISARPAREVERGQGVVGGRFVVEDGRLPRGVRLVQIAPPVPHARDGHHVGRRGEIRRGIERIRALRPRENVVRARSGEWRAERGLPAERPLAGLVRVENAVRLEVDAHRRIGHDYVVELDKIVKIVLALVVVLGYSPYPESRRTAVVKRNVNPVETCTRSGVRYVERQRVCRRQRIEFCGAVTHERPHLDRLPIGLCVIIRRIRL